jgi:hypothetical protein
MFRADRFVVVLAMAMLALQMAAIGWVYFGEGRWILGSLDAMLAAWWFTMAWDVWQNGVE